GAYNLCVYLTENVNQTGPGYDQANFYNNEHSSPLYHAGNPIANYAHHNVMRKVITSLDGITIPQDYQRVGGEMIYSQTFILPAGVRVNEASIVAFIYNKTTR